MKESELKVTETVLSPGKYVIPEGYRGILIKGVLTVQPKKNRGIQSDEYRCRDCLNRAPGYCNNSQYHTTMVCEKHPKPGGTHGRELFYHAPRLRKACSDFELDESAKESKYYDAQ